MGMDLRNQVVWVAGASQGIGRATARAFAAENSEVVLTARNETILRAMAHEFREHGFKTAVLPADLSKPETMDRVGEQIENLFGRLDVLVNCTGVLTSRVPMHRVTIDEWNETMTVNLRGAFLCQRVALRLMLPDRKGLVVHLSSGAGKRPAANWGPYSISKAGLEMLVKASAEDYKDTGIRFIAFNPGPTRTAMRAKACPNENPDTLKPPEKVAEFILQIARGDLGLPSGASVDYPEGP